MSKEILMIISDQHAYKLQGNAGNQLVRTPNLDRLAQEGTVFRDAYAACPLCVPSRLSLLAGRFPSNIRSLTNEASLDSTTATFVHSLNAAGYETTLCGRMHFVGPDQRHGFMNRLVGDITPSIFSKWSKPTGADALPWNGGRIEQVAIQCMGGGDSTVLEFDRDVTRAAIDYLAADHQEPQFLCVGMYAPHFPYIAPKELFDYYYDRVEIPEGSLSGDEHPIFSDKFRDPDPATIRAAMAAYYGMTEFMDQNIGLVLTAWNEYLKRTGREGLVIYVSDHGDSNGEHGFYGKNTFYDASAHVPMIFCGAGIPAGREYKSPVSLLDLSPTLCEMTGAPTPPKQDGKSLYPYLCGEEEETERIVVSEISHRFGRESIGRMAKWKGYKYVTFSGFDPECDQLFTPSSDSYETQDLSKEEPEITEKLRTYIRSIMKSPEAVLEEIAELKANIAIISASRQERKDEWQIKPGLAEEAPVPMIASKVKPYFGSMKR